MPRGADPERRLPFRHRTPGRGRIGFSRLSERGDDSPPFWVRKTLARHLHEIERRIGARISRHEAPRVVSKPLGCGTYGCVFALEDGRVLKITSDEDEGPLVEIVRRLQQAGQKAGRWPILTMTARIDDVFQLPRKVRVDEGLDPQRIYIMVRERVGEAATDLPGALPHAVDFYTAGWNSFCVNPDDPGGRGIGLTIARMGIGKIENTGADGARMGAFLRSMWKTGVPIIDVHRYNIARRIESGEGGARSGQVVIFDFSGAPSYDPNEHGCDQYEIARRIMGSPVDLMALGQEIEVL